MAGMSQFLQEVQFWHWLTLGVLLLGLEVVLPGTFFLWMGVSAGIVSGILFIVPDFDWQNQIFVFGVFSVVAVVAWRYWLKGHPVETADSTLNVRGAQYIGRVLVLADPIVDGVGKAKVGDSLWRVSTSDEINMPEGARVRVTGVEGATLVVEKPKE